MKTIFSSLLSLLVLLGLMAGCSSNDVSFKKKTNVTYSDEGIKYEMIVKVDTVPYAGGDSYMIDIENTGNEKISLAGESAIYEDANGKELKDVGLFLTQDSFSPQVKFMSHFIVWSKEKNWASVVIPPNAASLIFKNPAKTQVYFRIALK